MGARFPIMVSICLFSGTEMVCAQTASETVHELPPVVVSQTKPGIKHGRSENAPPVRRPPPPIAVASVTTPLAGPSTDAANVDKFPASISAVDARQIERAGSLNVADALQKYVPGIIVNE